VILDANPFGHSCARACPVEVLCEGACVLNDRDEAPIKIALLQRHATDRVLEHGWKLFEAGTPTGKTRRDRRGRTCRPRVRARSPAIRSCGHGVRGEAQPGGLNTYGIAEYKLKADVALAEVQDILDLGVELKMGVMVTAIEPFLKEYDAVFVGVGLGSTKRLGIPGEELPGVIDALTFIEHLKTHPYNQTPVGRNVVVIGAGNTAIDAVTQAKRLGATSSTIVYRRGEADMSAYHYEYELAKKDGCGFRFNAAPRRIVGNGAVAGLELSSGETIPCDMVIVAIGQGARAELRVPADPRVFTGGDCANGGAEIVNAAAEGVAAAKKIHERLTHG
jgi:glutamate synthase (NADPH/NADH) small chain